MKKAGKIALCVAGAVVVCCGAAVAWQWNNIKAAGYLLTLDGATLDTRIEENERALDGAMEKYNVQSYSFSPEEVAGLTSGELSADEAAARVLEAVFDAGGDVDGYVAAHGLGQISDPAAVEEAARAALAANPKALADWRAGKGKAKGFLVGQVMARLQGRADPALVNRAVDALLEESK